VTVVEELEAVGAGHGRQAPVRGHLQELEGVVIAGAEARIAFAEHEHGDAVRAVRDAEEGRHPWRHVLRQLLCELAVERAADL